MSEPRSARNTGLAIGALLIIVVSSYRQTVRAYPSGGGAYIVSKDNLGTLPGLVAAAALALTANKALVGGRVYSLTLWYGSVMGETLILLLGCCLLLWEGRKVAALKATAQAEPAREAA